MIKCHLIPGKGLESCGHRVSRCNQEAEHHAPPYLLFVMCFVSVCATKQAKAMLLISRPTQVYSELSAQIIGLTPQISLDLLQMALVLYLFKSAP